MKCENPNLVNVELDARYDNPIYNSGVTQFQAGTQVQTMYENNTENKENSFCIQTLVINSAMLRQGCETKVLR
jgi:hypothetical protein